MKSVLISIQPKWVEKIASGEKTIEVRKTRPKLETPFKCYIYCTKGKQYLQSRNNLIFYLEDKAILGGHGVGWYQYLNGRVIGEFVCDSIEMVNAKCSDYGIDLFYHDCLTKGCLTEREVERYFNIPEDKDLRVMKGNGYAWGISDLKIYDKPKELGEFRTPCKMGYYPCCGICDYAVHGMDGDLIDCDTSLTRPPQSWQFVESLGE